MADAERDSERGIGGRRFALFGLIVAGIASVIGLAHLVGVAAEKVRDGRGFETYRTFWLVEFSYVGVLVLFGAIILVVPVCAWLWWREEREWRDFERKYGVRRNA
jgi:hypothetical protein